MGRVWFSFPYGPAYFNATEAREHPVSRGHIVVIQAFECQLEPLFPIVGYIHSKAFFAQPSAIKLAIADSSSTINIRMLTKLIRVQYKAINRHPLFLAAVFRALIHCFCLLLYLPYRVRFRSYGNVRNH